MSRHKLLAILIVSALPGIALAGTESGFYIGAGVGQASIDEISADDVDIDSFDADDTGFKIFGGYNFGIVPLIDLAIEGGYVDFGEPDDNGIAVDANGYDIFGLAGVNLGPVGLFAKVGYVMWDADVSGDVSGGDDGSDPAYGVGARLKFGSLEVRAEYELFDIDAAGDVDFLSASGVWTF